MARPSALLLLLPPLSPLLRNPRASLPFSSCSCGPMASSILSSRCSLSSPAAAVARALAPPRMTLACRFQSSVPMPLGSMAVRSVASRNSSLSAVAPGKHCRSCSRLLVLGRRRCNRGDYAYHQLVENLCGSVRRFVDHVLCVWC